MKPTGKFKHRMQGAIAIIVGLAITVMVAFLGLVIDLGRLYTNKTELSNASDACALAAAGELTGGTDSLIRAENAAFTVTQRNLNDFQRNTAPFAFDQTVTFSDILNDPNASTYVTKNNVTDISKIRYARCTMEQTGILPWFMEVMGFGAQIVRAHAIATLTYSGSNCGIPIALIEQKAATCSFGSNADGSCKCPDGSSTNTTYGFCPGEWYQSRFDPGGGLSGSFKWVDFDPPSGGANELKDMMAGNGKCGVEPETPIGQSGVDESVANAWNTRFGLYQGSYKYPDEVPDYTGFAYTSTSWPEQKKAYKGTTAKSGVFNHYQESTTTTPVSSGHNDPYQGDGPDPGSGLDVVNGSCNPSKCATQQMLADKSANRRIVLMPMVRFDAWLSSNTAPLKDWGCVLLLEPMGGPGTDTHVEFIGMAATVGGPCASYGGMPNPNGNGAKVPSLVR